MVTHDEASCYVPAAIRPSVILSHWGRKDKGHKSNSGYWEDVYSQETGHPQVSGGVGGARLAGCARLALAASLKRQKGGLMRCCWQVLLGTGPRSINLPLSLT